MCFHTLFLRRQIYICIRFILSEHTHSYDTSHWQCAVWWITPYKTHIWKENRRRNRIKNVYMSDIMFCGDELQECLALLHILDYSKIQQVFCKCKKLITVQHHHTETPSTKYVCTWIGSMIYFKMKYKGGKKATWICSAAAPCWINSVSGQHSMIGLYFEGG